MQNNPLLLWLTLTGVIGFFLLALFLPYILQARRIEQKNKVADRERHEYFAGEAAAWLAILLNNQWKEGYVYTRADVVDFKDALKDQLLEYLSHPEFAFFESSVGQNNHVPQYGKGTCDIWTNGKILLFVINHHVREGARASMLSAIPPLYIKITQSNITVDNGNQSPKIIAEWPRK